MQDLTVWFLANSEWLSFPLMGLFGGTIGHVLLFETSAIQWSAGKHVWMLIGAWLKALFIGTCMYYLQQVIQWNLPMMFLLTGVLSVFGSQTILLGYNVVVRWIKKRLEINAP